MKALDPALDLDAFWRFVASAPRRALLLDFDGTLAPFASDRLRPRMREGVAAAVVEIARSGKTRVAIVTGRDARELRSLLPADLSAEIWGSHGLERLDVSGAYEAPAATPQVAAVRDAAAAWVVERGHEPNLEIKPFGFALHRRADPEAYDRLRPELLRRWEDEASRGGLDLLEFDGGFEFRPAGHHKGEVVRRVIAEEGPGSAVAYLGDDWTDEDAFRALDGNGLSVLVRGSSGRPAPAPGCRPRSWRTSCESGPEACIPPEPGPGGLQEPTP
jgi:trehalose-phosphatase